MSAVANQAASFAELLELALEVGREAADGVRRAREGVVEVADTKSTVVDVVTATDRSTEQLIRRRIGERRPGDAFLGEEGGAVGAVGAVGADGQGGPEEAGKGSGVRWIVDPIDGTVNFLYDTGFYSVSIAAEVGGEVVLGVVIDCAAGTEFTAIRGQGSFADGRRLAVRPYAPLDQRLVATGFGYDPDVRRTQAEALVGFLPLVRDLRRFGSCALDLCRVAEGKVDAYLEEGVHEWDYAAGALVASEAGARVRVRPARWSGFSVVAQAADGFEELVEAALETRMIGE